ncbi:hypothetical protein F383_08099 [Gossypium arboreum]|uniref:Uncharacterized protein n=1 Tax=Gossypium arboreum TaxID=29729 RepID=A0A0B0NDL8_GOSAR|nr:hypothetical protein F383_08099 [Gossypium arboreum]
MAKLRSNEFIEHSPIGHLIHSLLLLIDVVVVVK